MTDNIEVLGEPVAWQYRYKHALPDGGMCRWHECTEQEAKECQRHPKSHAYEARPLYAPKEQRP